MTLYTNVVTQPIVSAGIARTLAAADTVNGNVIDTGRILLEVNNTGGSALTVTIQTNSTVDGMAVGPRVVTVAAAAFEFIPIYPANYAQPSSSVNAGRAQVTFSAACNIGVFQMP
jgi:hypothetical protein